MADKPRKRKKPAKPEAIQAGGQTHYLELFRLVKCSDGVVRLEHVPNTDAPLRLSEDDNRNLFLTGYIHESFDELRRQARDTETPE